MKTIKSLKNITTLEVGDVVVFGSLVYKVRQNHATDGYYLYLNNEDTPNEFIFEYLNLNTKLFIKSIGINACTNMDFPETQSLEALTAIVSALFKEYEKQNSLPKTWEEFCTCCNSYHERKRNINMDKNLCVSLQEAKAFIALMQLRQLRKAYVKDWEPDWTDANEDKYCISLKANHLDIQYWYRISKPLSFPTCELAEQFLTNFKDLLEIAKPLL